MDVLLVKKTDISPIITV